MKYLKLYENFKEGDILYIFDLDDTLVDTPRFEELVIEYLKEDMTIGSILKRSVSQINKSINDLKIENGRIYIQDTSNEIEVNGDWIRKGKRVYLVAPSTFNLTDLSLPKKTKELSTLYKSVKNKAIVTGRMNRIKGKIEKVLDDFGLDQPNYGLFCYPNRDEISDRVAVWKAKTIVNLIEETGFKNVKFYDDNSKWVNRVTREVKKELPNINWEGIKVK